MKFTTPLLVLQSVACAAFTLPDNLPNGVYRAHVNSEGLEVSEGLTVDYKTTVTPRKTTNLLKSRQTKDEGGWDRDQPDMWCGCGCVQILETQLLLDALLINFFIVFP